MTIGTEIRRARKSMRLTLKTFSMRVGLPWQTLQAYETDRVVPSSDRLLVILHVLRAAPEPIRLDQVAEAVFDAAEAAKAA